ncbi:MAG: epimerase [Gemmatimonadetes bacterium]|nr:epimerase [Gemmatimonadota bacterium]
MNVLLFGATGMVGDGVLHECLGDERVRSVLVVGRSALGLTHPKLRERRRSDFYDYADLATELAQIGACFFCLGVSSAGMDEAEYHRQTFDLTIAAARALASAHPRATFCYVSGEGTDSSERGRTMWARVKGKTENALLALPLEAYMFRPGFIRARPGARSKTPLYRILYMVLAPLYPVLKRIAPTHVTTAENIGRAMIAVAANGYPKRVLENADINALGGDE